MDTIFTSQFFDFLKPEDLPKGDAVADEHAAVNVQGLWSSC